MRVNNTVFLQNPIFFDAPYDSTINIDESLFVWERLKYYARLCGFSISNDKDCGVALYEFALHLYNEINKGNSLEAIFKLAGDNNRVDRINELFVLRLKNVLLKKSNISDS